MIEIEAPDGSVVEFPDGTPDTAIKSAMQKAFGAPKAKPQSSESALSASNVGLQQGLTFGFGDELTAGAMAPIGASIDYFGGKGFDLGRAYDENLQFGRDRVKTAREQHPGASLAGELAGGLVTGGGLAKSGATLAGRTAGRGLLTRAAAGATEGAAYGGAYGFGTGEGGAENRLSNAKTQAAVGAALGGAVPLAGAAIKAPYEALKRRAITASAPTNEALRETAKQAYKVADDAGLQFSQGGYKQLMQGVSDDLANGGYNPRLNPKISAVVDELAGLEGSAPTLQRLEQVRRVALNAAKSNEPAERALAGRIVENIDDFVERISPKDIIAGTNRTKAVMALKEGRETWKRLRKSEMLDEAFLKAENQASGFENGLRTQFRSIINNKKLRRMFSKEEQAALIKVVRGGPVENALKLIGKLGFSEGQATNMLGASIGAGAGAAVGGPVGAAAVPLLGTAARRGAQAATRSNAELARALVRAGKITEQQAPRIIQMLEAGTIDPAAIAGLVSTSN